MKIGITCYPTYGGSGTVATELGKALASRGHKVHFISYSLPYRLQKFNENVSFHEVSMMQYPLFEYPPYSLALAAKMVEVVESQDLDLLHVHYAIPHATSAYLTKQMLEGRPKVITTLHGTDITIVGNDDSYFRITQFSIDKSDGITTVSDFLKKETEKHFNIKTPIEVIHNFVDTNHFRRDRYRCAKSLFALDNERIVMHISNFRPVKRIEDVIFTFAGINSEVPSKLIMVGDGPLMSTALRMVNELGVSDDTLFLGKQSDVAGLLAIADLYLLPSDKESFGLSALEAQSCSVPVIGANVGGLPEVIDHGHTGWLVNVGDVKTMAEYGKKLLTDEKLYQETSEKSRRRVLKLFSQERIIGLYEQYYEKIMDI
ncbi:N-acetyl-alpha-D-glucosaminyl L-malate synthase BshA [Candidatus Poribacteria bacterium]|nr:N-acetyl-alpha-D-glucosaminyl L-malate synthase BshA [Candidatus Poribacteria bacterium]